MEETWSIGELAERAAVVLRAESQPVNGRVREVPSERLIRWYTTIGLVDPPLTRRGRIAQYGTRHLLQLVAIKRLQAQGRSIAEIQAALTGATDTHLAQTAAHPTVVGPTTPAPTPGPITTLPASSPAPRPRFWAERPSPTAAARRTVAPNNADPATRHTGAQEAPAETQAARDDTPVASAIVGVRLGVGVTLLLDGVSRTPSEDDIEAVLAAAGPLLTVLEERRLA